MRNLRADLSRYREPWLTAAPEQVGWRIAFTVIATQGCWACIGYRFERWAVGVRSPALRVPALAAAHVVHKLVELATGISISRTARIGPGLYIGHFGGIIVGAGVQLGADCNISQGVTLGEGKVGGRRGVPTIGDRVYIAPGAKAFGPIRVGNDVSIGANAVVARDVPDGVVVAGVPAEIVSQEPGSMAIMQR